MSEVYFLYFLSLYILNHDYVLVLNSFNTFMLLTHVAHSSKIIEEKEVWNHSFEMSMAAFMLLLLFSLRVLSSPLFMSF